MKYLEIQPHAGAVRATLLLLSLSLFTALSACDGCDNAASSGGAGPGGGGAGGTSSSGGGGSTSSSSGGPSSSASAGGGGSTGSSSGGGGAGGSEPGPGMLSGPRDRTVVEGQPYTFDVTSSGPALGYEWQRGTAPTFVTIPGATTSHLAGGPSALSDDLAGFRVLVSGSTGTVTSRTATLHVLPLTSAAYVSRDSCIGHAEDHVEIDWSTATCTGHADLASGRISLAAITPNGQVGSTAAVSVNFYNNTGATVTLPEGSISAHVHAVYTGNSAASTTVCNTTANLQASQFAQAIFTHQGDVQYQNGVPVNETHVYSPGGTNGHVNLVAETSRGVEADLVLSAFDLPAGDRFNLLLQITVGSYFSTNELATPATLDVVLPPGVELDTNSIVPLAWVHP